MTTRSSINFVVLGRKETASEFGKMGTSSDITIHDKKARDAIRTWIVPTGFPEKIQPLFQAINMSEHVIFHVNALDRFVGEQIIALDLLQRRSGILTHTYDVDEARLESMIKGTTIEEYDRVPSSEIVNAMQAMGPANANGKESEVIVDHAFDVKGVGTVVLGRVASGTIRQYDKLILYPAGSEVLVKSIQMHDDPAQEASYPARVGLALKGIRPEEIQRGDILAGGDRPPRITTEIDLEFEPSRFYKRDITENQGCIVAIGLQAKAAKIVKTEMSGHLGLKFEKPIIVHDGETAAVLRPESVPVRIAGAGRIIQA